MLILVVTVGTPPLRLRLDLQGIESCRSHPDKVFEVANERTVLTWSFRVRLMMLFEQRCCFLVQCYTNLWYVCNVNITILCNVYPWTKIFRISCNTWTFQFKVPNGSVELVSNHHPLGFKDGTRLEGHLGQTTLTRFCWHSWVFLQYTFIKKQLQINPGLTPTQFLTGRMIWFR